MPIDVHAHYVPSRIIATLEERAKDFGVSLVKTPPQCAIHFDYGQSKYAHKDGLASTIIDFGDFSVIRVGHCFDRLKQAFAARFGITLRT